MCKWKVNKLTIICILLMFPKKLSRVHIFGQGAMEHQARIPELHPFYTLLTVSVQLTTPDLKLKQMLMERSK